MTFETLCLHPKILEAVAKAGYSKPTKIQCKAIPKILKGFDIRASAHTGTGKTAAFLLPVLNRLVTSKFPNSKGPKVLILVPTRELAMQIATQTEKYSRYLRHINTVSISGGIPYPVQMRKLSRPYDVLIATPGRLIDLINRRKVDLSRLQVLVLDEADRMLDMGFLEPVKQIVALTPPSRQTLLFSATLEEGVNKLSEEFLDKPMEIVAHAKRAKQENIEQTLHYADDLHHKNRLLCHVLNNNQVESALVFTSTKRHADQLSEELVEEGYQVEALHGDMNQRQRTRTIMRWKRGKFKILVATDIAARGIDVQSVTHVINFDLPRSREDYVHRIGRTGRAGAKGIALSFVTKRDAHLVKKIEQFTGQEINVTEIAGLEPKGKRCPLRFAKKNPRSSKHKDYSFRRTDRFSKGKGKKRKKARDRTEKKK